jgi:hypothetical protein
MRRALFIAGLVVGLLLLAAVGAAISFTRSIRSHISFAPSLAIERSTTT